MDAWFFLSLFQKLAIVAYALALMNFYVQFINKHVLERVKKGSERFQKVYKSFVRFFARGHKWFALSALLLMGGHAILTILNIGFSVTGFLVGLGMTLTLLMGLLKATALKKAGRWTLYVHSVLAFLSLAAIIAHEVGFLV